MTIDGSYEQPFLSSLETSRFLSLFPHSLCLALPLSTHFSSRVHDLILTQHDAYPSRAVIQITVVASAPFQCPLSISPKHLLSEVDTT